MTTPRLRVRSTRPEHIPGIIDLSARIYGSDSAWAPAQLLAHIALFPEGQFVAVVPREDGREQVIGMAASLRLKWELVHLDRPWREITAHGMFSTHDPQGMTLYGAEVMADPDRRGQGIGSALYRARDKLVGQLGLKRIRAGARLRGYHKVADVLSPESYVAQVVAGRRRDPTLSFQLRRGFEVIRVIGGYLRNDPESQGWAAVIDRLNPALATARDREAARRWRERAGIKSGM
ncbi:MAG TPA: GNAT family N-acetyltransferase [Gemmatimonadales bacterium]|nr:GNAT family N-acetyltransferase [Gemmatimonadales bacterium]